MKDSTDPRRVARIAIALFCTFGLAVMVIPGGVSLDWAFAQQSPSPGATGPRIQFLNPSGTTGSEGPGTEISAKNDGTNTTYHLVAWVQSVPANATVEFKYQRGSDPDVTIGTGTLRGNDTFDLEWNVGTLADGNYTLKAILFSGGQEVSRDEEDVEVNNSSDTGEVRSEEDQGATVEMTYPTIAGTFGMFRKPGTNNPFAGVIDVSISTDTTSVRAYYTTAAPGSEPDWVECATGASETAAQAANGVRCTLEAGVSPGSVTAVATAVNNPQQNNIVPPIPDNGPDSGDAHRATGYVQVASSVTITGSGQQHNDADAEAANNQFPCSDAITATVFDQSSRKVAGANVDVHASGPTDNLFFDDSSGANSSANQAPNSNHAATEAAVNCEDTGTPKEFGDSEQGDHEVAGEGDSKHIEATAAGTNDAGAFVFQLYNRSETITGGTQFTAYYDRDDDDRLCSEEPAGNGSIGWGVAAPSPTGMPAETTTCPEPAPTASPTATGSPTGSPTATGSPTGSPSPAQTPTQSRTITLTSSKGKVVAGRTVTLSGTIFSSDNSCTDNEFVRIRRRIHGTNTFQDFKTATTGSDGGYQASAKIRKSADYRALAPAHDQCQDATSDPTSVLAKVKVSISVSDTTPARGTTIAIRGGVSPKHRGTKVILQRRKGRRWVRVAADTLNGRSRYAFSVDATWRRARAFRVRWKSQDDDHRANKSKVVRVRTHA